jgi:steroid delta-isomerase-like uncharacterized protein
MPTSPADTEALIRRYFAGFNAGDIESMLSCLAEDVVHDVNQGERRHGKASFRSFCLHMARCYTEELRDIVVMVTADGGARAAAEFVVQGRYVATDHGLPEALGQRYTLPAGSFFTIEDDLITRVTTYYNLQDWLAQVGAGGGDGR